MGRHWPLILLLLVTTSFAQQWNAANFPNPTAGGFKQCRMKMSANICDPDGVLDESSRYRIDHDLKQLEARTRQDHGREFCERKGITGAMAVARKIQGGRKEDAEALANDILKKWRLDEQCHKAVVIVVSTDDMQFWVARDDRVPVTDDEFTELFMKEKDNFRSGRYQVALSSILQGTWSKALSKQGPRGGQGGGGGGQRGGQGGGSGFGGGGQGGGSGFGGGGGGGKPGGTGMPKLPSIPPWFWIVLVCVVIPLLCCGCLCYCCCCRGKGGGGGGASAGGQPSGGYSGGVPAGGGGGGGGGRGGGMMGNFLGTLGGMGAGNLIGRLLSGGGGRRGGDSGGGGFPAGGGGGYPAGGGGYGGGDAGYGGGGGAPYGGGGAGRYDDGQGGGLYPSEATKSRGGGGSWA